MNLFCNSEDLLNESDVEQKLVYPMLTSEFPIGFGYSKSDFRTKTDLRQIPIEKGKNYKLFYPDYIIILSGLPVLIIEAKHPKENLEEGFREARLYATEVNSRFTTNLNPCRKIISTNGNEIWAGYWDQENPVYKVSFNDIYVENIQYNKVINFASKEYFIRFTKDIFKFFRDGRLYKRPNQLLGGLAVQNEELEQNSFGASLALDYRHIFNPQSMEDREEIVNNAYVESKKRQKHVDPIKKIIRAAKPPSLTDAREIEDSSKPKELVDVFRQIKLNKHQLLLLIGSVGSGKSTFTDYLKVIALPQDIKDSTVWVTLDLNIAPLSKEEIYTWIRKNIINFLKQLHQNKDFEKLDVLLKLFSSEINQVKKGPGALFNETDIEYKKLIAEKIQTLQNNDEAYLKAIIRYLCAERGKSLIVVLDNCDKRKRDDQLLMFEVAKWLQQECECIVFLPIRDTTYDLHRKEPPLDTAIKDLTFRIDPPDLVQVIYKRVRLALRAMKKDGKNFTTYTLGNGITVEYPLSEQGMYLACILKSIFQMDSFFSRVISGLAGRDIRRGIEIFLDFCKSGHIEESEFLKITYARGDHSLPTHIVTRILIRGNKRFYSDSNSRIKNLFFCSADEEMPDPFTRVSILRWLKEMYRIAGPNNVLGFHKISKLINSLVPLGHDAKVLMNEINNLIIADCIFTESQAVNSLDEEDLISISPSGHIHLNFLSNLDYLAAVAEDVWFRNERIAETISRRIAGLDGKGHYSFQSVLDNATDLINYLENYKKFYLSNPKVYLADAYLIPITDLEGSKDAIRRASYTVRIESDIEQFKKDYPKGLIIQGRIISIQPYGIFVEFGLSASGLIHVSQLADKNDGSKILFENLEVGDWINVEILNFNDEHKRFNLKFIQNEMEELSNNNT